MLLTVLRFHYTIIIFRAFKWQIKTGRLCLLWFVTNWLCDTGQHLYVNRYLVVRLFTCFFLVVTENLIWSVYSVVNLAMGECQCHSTDFEFFLISRCDVLPTGLLSGNRGKVGIKTKLTVIVFVQPFLSYIITLIITVFEFGNDALFHF